MASTVMGAEPTAGSRGRSRAPGQRVRRAKPLEAEALLAFGRSMEALNLPIFLKIANAKFFGPSCSNKAVKTACKIIQIKLLLLIL